MINPITSALAKLLVKIKAVISNDLSLGNLRRQHGAGGNTIVRLDIYEDKGRTRIVWSGQYRVTDDGLVDVPNTVEPNAISQTDYDTIRNLIRGKRAWTYQGRKYEESYNYMRAFTEGRVTVTKLREVDGYLGDMSLFEELYEKVLPKLKDTIGKYI